jgi:hypothetical protein
MKNEKVFLRVAIAPSHGRVPGGSGGRQTPTDLRFSNRQWHESRLHQGPRPKKGDTEKPRKDRGYFQQKE